MFRGLMCFILYAKNAQTRNMEKHSVKLYVYDISRGMAKQMSPLLLGKQIDGIWHTGVVCFGREYFYGGGGIDSCHPGGTILGPPHRVVDLGETEINQELFMDFLRGLQMQNFRPESYHLFEHNCNTFSNEIAMFLTGSKIPQHIQDLPADVLNSGFGQMIKPLIESMTVSPAASGSATAPSQPSHIFEPREGSTLPASSTASRQKPQGSPTGCQRYQTMEPVVHNRTDVPSVILQFKEDLKKEDSFKESDLSQLDDIEKVLSSDQSSSLKEEHIQLLGKFISCKLDSQGKAALYPVASLQELSVQPALQILQVMASRQEFTKCRSGKSVLQKLVEKFSCMTSSMLQVVTVHVLCNAVSHEPGHSSLLSTSTMSTELSNAAVTSLLQSDDTLQEAGAELAFNISRFEVDEDIAMECSTAVIEVLNRTASKSTVRHCLYALRNFSDYNPEVVTLAHVMGVDPATYKGDSKEVDQLCLDLQKLMR